ncbi:unnamed protein product [Bursaphelenchus okinawaensis]|uniref:Uncharacterized protein n=1 Tax=Bursaphelenchus okinawaensis TaxID=465554 RepID=A0A811K8J6_9BILA|nr:unnamed protein product [Bursaphelenchus okinawaensis]CAG9093236.1 unnamed protein product [Bursaphelenchus okinawaensis]
MSSINNDYTPLNGPGGMPRRPISTVPRQRTYSRQNSEESSTRRRPLHPAEKKAAQLRLPQSSFEKKSSNPHHAMQALRRLSRADFSSIRRARLRGHLNYKQIGHRFGRQSTIHGISHAATAPTKKCAWLWIAAFIICFIALIIQIIFLINKYTRYDKTVDLDLKFENAPFPSVTLCNLNPYKASKISGDPSTKAMMSTFQNLLSNSGRADGIAAVIAQTKERRRLRRQLNGTVSEDRRYLQVYAQCYCEINRLSGERRSGSCFGVHKGKIALNFIDNNLHNFHPTKCLCQLDWTSKALWPCFPYSTWKEKICTECVPDLGHCPMRFYNGKQEKKKLQGDVDICLCHKEYNHCIANNENGEIPEILPTFDVETMNFTQAFITAKPKKLEATTTTTTEAPEIKQALGYEELKNDISIATQARENIKFAVGEKNESAKVQMSQELNELIMECTFNQKDCDIEKDFNRIHDATFGNCYTFNWNRTRTVTAHRAGANFGLRVLLYANVSEYLPTTEAVGFRITVHDKWVVPFPDAFGHTAPTGFMSSFGVRMKQFYRISKPHGSCADGGEEAETYVYKNYKYSVEGCHRSCTQHKVISTCGCADPSYPIPESSTMCKMTDPIARECIKNTTQYMGRLIAEQNVCDCHQPCSELGYEVSYSAARWPSGTTKLRECQLGDDMCMEKYRKNAAMIQIFFEELNFETLTESPAYTWMSCLADLGGMLGLWIGASVVSVLEIVALAFYVAQAYVRQRKKSTSTLASIRNKSVTKKISLQSQQSSLVYRPRTPTPSTTKSRLSLLNDDPDPEPLKLEAGQDEQEPEPSDDAHSKSSYPYWPPGQDLPCTCLYNSNGNIISMKALCPEHGYMVRRGTMFSCGEGEDEDRDEKPDEEDVTPEEEQMQEAIDVLQANLYNLNKERELSRQKSQDS